MAKTYDFFAEQLSRLKLINTKDERSFGLSDAYWAIKHQYLAEVPDALQGAALVLKSYYDTGRNKGEKKIALAALNLIASPQAFALCFQNPDTKPLYEGALQCTILQEMGLDILKVDLNHLSPEQRAEYDRKYQQGLVDIPKLSNINAHVTLAPIGSIKDSAEWLRSGDKERDRLKNLQTNLCKNLLMLFIEGSVQSHTPTPKRSGFAGACLALAKDAKIKFTPKTSRALIEGVNCSPERRVQLRAEFAAPVAATSTVPSRAATSLPKAAEVPLERREPVGKPVAVAAPAAVKETKVREAVAVPIAVAAPKLEPGRRTVSRTTIDRLHALTDHYFPKDDRGAIKPEYQYLVSHMIDAVNDIGPFFTEPLTEAEREELKRALTPVDSLTPPEVDLREKELFENSQKILDLFKTNSAPQPVKDEVTFLVTGIRDQYKKVKQDLFEYLGLEVRTHFEAPVAAPSTVTSRAATSLPKAAEVTLERREPVGKPVAVAAPAAIKAVNVRARVDEVVAAKRYPNLTVEETQTLRAEYERIFDKVLAENIALKSKAPYLEKELDIILKNKALLENKKSEFIDIVLTTHDTAKRLLLSGKGDETGVLVDQAIRQANSNGIHSELFEAMFDCCTHSDIANSTVIDDIARRWDVAHFVNDDAKLSVPPAPAPKEAVVPRHVEPSVSVIDTETAKRQTEQAEATRRRAEEAAVAKHQAEEQAAAANQVSTFLKGLSDLYKEHQQLLGAHKFSTREKITNFASLGPALSRACAVCAVLETKTSATVEEVKQGIRRISEDLIRELNRSEFQNRNTDPELRGWVERARNFITRWIKKFGIEIEEYKSPATIQREKENETRITFFTKVNKVSPAELPSASSPPKLGGKPG